VIPLYLQNLISVKSTSSSQKTSLFLDTSAEVNMGLPRPPYDAELGAALAQMPSPVITKEILLEIRKGVSEMYSAETALAGKPLIHEEKTISGPNGDIILSIFRPKTSPTSKRAGIYQIHGGGMVVGNRFLGMQGVLDWVEALDAVCVSVEYRLAPENPDPAPIEDVYAGLLWVGENLGTLGIDPEKLIISGQSAGGGLAAGLALLVRDRGGPSIRAQCLVYPMLDDRTETVSSQQFDDSGIWRRDTNITAWSFLLGEQAKGKNVSIYAAPGRATDLSGLPSTFIDVSSTEVFRDECVAYASRLWATGIQAELHVWPGAFHGFDQLAPSAVISQAASRARLDWLRRILSSA
jgi:acetyl esterase/lipase